MRSWRRWLLAALALQFTALALWEARTDGPVVDEAFDVAGGLAAVVHRDAGFVPEHGLLPRVLAALPATAAGPEVPRGEGFRSGDWFQFTEDVLRANDDGDDLTDLLFLARLVPVALALATGLGIAHLARSLFGPDAGLVAGAAWFTLPVIVGLGHLATTDVPFAAAAVGVSCAVLRFVRRTGDGSAALVGLAVGVALLTRHLALVLLATSVLVVAVEGPPGWRRRLRHGALCALVAIATVWVVTRLVAPGGGDDARLAGIVAAGRDGALGRLALAVPWPQEWAAGLSYLLLTSDPRPAYLFGQSWTGGRWWFFPGSLLVKVPATAVAAMVAGVVLFLRRSWGGSRREATLVVGVPAVALAVGLSAQPLNLGLRYAVPVLALGLVLASPVASVLRARAGQLALGAVLAIQVVALWVAVPHSLAWTPPPFTDGYRWASDSNVDYGQDLLRLREWEHIEGARVAVVTPRGLSRPAGSRPLVDVDPADVTGWVAAGATPLTVTERDALSWLRAYCPVGTIGGSVLLYFFDEPPTAEPGPTMPAAPCSGDVSVRSG